MLSLLLFFATSVAETLPPGSYAQCTTNPETYYQTSIRTNDALPREMKRTVVLRALVSPTSNPNYAERSFTEQWFYERETADAIFGGYDARGHYLGVAVLCTHKGVGAIVCDSANLKQIEDSMHKNAKLWKEDLNAAIRVELGRVTKKTWSAYGLP
ncbi:MAG: hypothetical protein ACI9NT_000776 [Bacteroidia bacterium]